MSQVSLYDHHLGKFTLSSIYEHGPSLNVYLCSMIALFGFFMYRIDTNINGILR